ncbi:MAG: hypothetical protein QF524_03455, partial [Planctomycetota bacterium]|nr:hypothetical protein [Planctomycetota bacterium]
MITLLTLALLQNPLSDFHLTERAANTFTHNRQVDQAIAADKDGNLLMVWGSRRQEVGTFGVFGAWLDPFGRPLGTELHINTTVQDNQLRPSAAFAPDGSAWVVWQSNAQDGDGFGVYARRLTLQENILEDGSTRTELLPKGDEIRVNQERSGDQIRPVLEFSSNGSAFVAWEDWSTGISQIKVRSFSQDGTPLCDEFLIAPNQNLRQTLPSIAPLAGERFAAVWSTSDSETGTPQGLQSRLVNLNMPLGSITRVDDQEEAGIEPSISSNAKDRYAIAWMSQAEGFGYGSWFRIFDSEKGALTEGAHVDAGGAGWRTGASVAMRPDGAFAIAYSNNKGKPPIAEPRRPHSDIDIRVQLFDRNGKSTSEGFRANKRTVEEQTLQTGLNTRHTLWTGKGQLAFAWHGNAEGDRRAAGLTLYAPKTLAKASIPEIEPVAAARNITMEQVYDTEIRPDWDPNWRPEPLNPATPRGGLGGF